MFPPNHTQQAAYPLLRLSRHYTGHHIKKVNRASLIQASFLANDGNERKFVPLHAWISHSSTSNGFATRNEFRKAIQKRCCDSPRSGNSYFPTRSHQPRAQKPLTVVYMYTARKPQTASSTPLAGEPILAIKTRQVVHTTQFQPGTPATAAEPFLRPACKRWFRDWRKERNDFV